MENFVPMAEIGQIPPGAGLAVSFCGTILALFNYRSGCAGFRGRFQQDRELRIRRTGSPAENDGALAAD